MRILCDIDGVITKYPFKYLVKKHFGVNISPLSIYAYDLADVLGVSHKSIDAMFCDTVFGKPSFISGAIETLTEWKGKHEIAIYSNRVKYMGFDGLVEWLVKYKIPFDGISLKGDGNYDVHIDDSPAKLMSTNSTAKILFSQPWNEGCLDITEKLVRVDGWETIDRLIKEEI